MYRLLILALLLGLTPVIAQDTETDETAPAADEASDDESSDDPYQDDFELDLGTDDHLEDDEDVFEASVEVSYQQSVSFPTDI